MTNRIILKLTSGRFIATLLTVGTCCYITLSNPESFGVRMFDFAAGVLVGYFGRRDQAVPEKGEKK